jgi:hypothetical protein
MPDDNDIIYTNYSPDLLGLVRKLAEMMSGSDTGTDSIMQFLGNLWDIWSVIAFLLSALFIYGIIYSYIRMNQLSEEEAQKLASEQQAWKDAHGSTNENRRWHEAQAHISSDNPNDWKLAIIEADIILGEVLDKAGYAGHSIGDQLKGASASSFATIQDAWDAHLIRNKIAHRSADFVLTHSMAKEAMIKFERVFREFDAV